MKNFWKFLVFLTCTAACQEEESFSRDSDETYFPLKTGFYQVYTVTEVRYSQTSGPESSTYEIMTQVVDSFPSGEHEHTYILHRSKRSSGEAPWQALDTWSVRKDQHQVIVAEGNTSFVKLRFPIAEGSRWNGNTFNTLGDDAYEIREVDAAGVFNGVTFGNTLVVEQERNEDRIVFRDVRSEVYARDIGLVSKEVVQLYYCTDDYCLGQQQIEHGMEMKMEITAYGQL